MKNYLLFILTIILFSCSNNKHGKEESEQIDSVETVIDTVVEEKLEIPVLPFFDLQFDDEGFKTFYYDLVKSCREKDTSKVFAAIHDTLRFSKYECAYGQFIPNDKSCSGCARCTKNGMIKGVFRGSIAVGVCEQLYDIITKFGVGKYTDNEYYSKYMPIANAYANFHFVEDTMYGKYFNYGAIIPLHDKVEIKTEISDVAQMVGYLPFQPITYLNEPGMGQFDELTKTNWLEFNQGYINSNDVLTGFDYTLVIYEKTNEGWKITGFFQPPGC